MSRVYVCDHFMPFKPDPRAPDPVLEGWTTLTAVAAATTRVGIGTLVLGNTYRHPAVVANMAATLDNVSGGRLVLGLGAGFQPNEHTAYGIDLPEPGPRLDRFEEAVQVIRMLLHERGGSFDGATYRLTGAVCAPAPLQAHLPLLLGGGGERRSIPIAAAYADEWHSWTTPTTFQHKSALLDEQCDTNGRAAAEVRRLTGQVVEVGAPVTDPLDDDADIVGPVDFAIERLAEYQAVGVDEFVLRDRAAYPLEAAKDNLSTLASDVIPRL